MKVFHSPKHALRQVKTELSGGELVSPFECPERMTIILEELQRRGGHDIHEPEDFGLAPAQSIHDAGYLSFLETVWQKWSQEGYKGEAIPDIWPSRSMRHDQVPRDVSGQLGFYAMAGETSIGPGTFEAAISSMHSAVAATKTILNGERLAFGLCRPPGHHASKDQFGGYCFLNNASIAAQYALDQGAGRVAILDVDFHHGNGTQSIFYDRNDVLTLSLHGDPLDAFPHFLGFADEKGEGQGLGFNLNLPLAKGTPFSKWSQALSHACAAIFDFRADLVVMSLGVDSFENDPISFFKLTNSDFRSLGHCVGQLGLPIVTVMEGGYAVQDIGVNTVNVLDGMEETMNES